MSRFRNMCLITGTENRQLAESVAKHLGVELADADVSRFPDGEINVKINSDVRGSDVFIIQSTCPPVNENLMEILILIDTLKRASADRITAVIPYYGYARKDRKDEGRVPITAKLVANVLERAGADRVMTVDLHASQIQGFFDIPVDHLYGSPIFIECFQGLGLENTTILATDVGSSKRAQAYARLLGGELAIIDKRRTGPDQTKVANVIGELKKRDVIIVDDMISTGGSITEAAKIASEHGASKIYLAATHPVFCGPAIERLMSVTVEKIFVSDTICVDIEKFEGKLEILSVAPLLSEAIKRVHMNLSISSIFEQSSKAAKE